MQQAQPIAPWGEVEEGVRSGLGKAEDSGTSSTAETPATLSPDCLGYDDRAVIVPCGHPLWLEAPVDPPWPGLLSGLEAFRQPLYRLV